MLALEMAAFWLSGQWNSASVIVAPAVTGSQILPPAQPQYKSWFVSAGDGDTLIMINHGFLHENGTPATPDCVVLTTIPSVANGALANWGAQITSTQIILSKTSATGSGGNPDLKVVAMRPHSIIQ